ncbi:MAG: GIY-YIG nuclease family protein [Candidatus Gracilibacteria bacterium]
MDGYLYILESKRNGRYYVGSTNDLERRIGEHNNGEEKATKGLVPLSLVYSEKYDTLLGARRREHQIKKYKSRKIIEKIIMGP